MRVFFDTSALFKKYADECGKEAFDEIIARTQEISVSPVTRIEISSILQRRVREKILSADRAEWLQGEVRKDFTYFHIVLWNESLEQNAINLAYKYGLKTLDAIQLASGILSKSDLFVTSDQKLYQEACKVLGKVQLI